MVFASIYRLCLHQYVGTIYLTQYKADLLRFLFVSASHKSNSLKLWRQSEYGEKTIVLFQKEFKKVNNMFYFILNIISYNYAKQIVVINYSNVSVVFLLK